MSRSTPSPSLGKEHGSWFWARASAGHRDLGRIAAAPATTATRHKGSKMGRNTPAKLPTANATTDNTDNSVTARDWSGRPLDEPAWFYSNLKSLYDEVEDAQLYVEKGIVCNSKGDISVSNLAHAQAYLNDTITLGTLDAPFELSSLPALTRVPAPLRPADPTTGAPAATIDPPIIPTALSQLGTGHERVRLNKETCERMGVTVLRHFTDKITNQGLRRSTVAAANNSGLKFITDMQAKMNRADSA